MGMSGLYGAADRDESIDTIHAALDAGVTLLDTSDFYGMGHNELVIGDALAGRRRDDMHSEDHLHNRARGAYPVGPREEMHLTRAFPRTILAGRGECAVLHLRSRSRRSGRLTTSQVPEPTLGRPHHVSGPGADARAASPRH
jgi:hypothetical protein